MKQLFFCILLATFFVVSSAQAQTVRIVKTPPQRLANFIYQTDEGKENLQKHYSGDLRVAARDLLVKAVDIDRNGTLEYLVSQKSLCRNADCVVALYQQKAASFVRLLSAPRLQLSPGYSEGKRNLMSCESVANPPRCSFLRWYKTEYVRYRCVEAKSNESGLKTKEIPCSEMK
jgi:hypothetical protein